MRRVAFRGAALALAAVTATAAAGLVAAQTRHSGVPEASSLARVAVPTASIRVGVLLAGGRHAAASEDIAAGIALAVAEARDIAGMAAVEILREDAADKPGDAVERAKRLIAADAAVLIGPATTREVSALREVAHTARVPLIVPVAGAAALALKCSPYVLHLMPAGEQVAGPLGTWIGARQAAKRIYLLAPDDAAAREMVSAFKRNFAATGGEIAGEEYVAAPNPDFMPYLAKLRLMEADAVYALFTGGEAGTFARQLDSIGLAKRVTLFSASPVDGAKAQAVTGALDYVPTLDTPRNRDFRDSFARLYGRAPTEHAARGYDAGRLVVEALRGADGNALDREHLTAALATVSFVGPRGPIRADPRRPAGPDRLYIVRSREDDNGHAYEVIDHVAAGAQQDVCATPPG